MSARVAEACAVCGGPVQEPDYQIAEMHRTNGQVEHISRDECIAYLREQLARFQQSI